MKIKSCSIRVSGIVQGVGFRPFIYKIAGEFSILGTVLNDSKGVLIQAEGEPDKMDNFIQAISEQAPSLAKIDRVEYKLIDLQNFNDFKVIESIVLSHKSTFIPPDTMLCDDCLKEYTDPDNKRFNYPFITCTNCGPRFSIINDIPYDRKNTEMAAFPLCRDCTLEYKDPLNRRFHTEPTACPICGPQISLYNSNQNLLLEANTGDIVQKILAKLKVGSIIAIKGVGGYHLACDATNESAVLTLRTRKNRPFKPFALMVGNLGKAEKIAQINSKEAELLLSRERPIILVKKKKITGICPQVAPTLSYLGIMLPYTPFQHSLFQAEPDAILVMTSANISSEPIIYSDEEIFRKMGKIADLFVTYNRKIHCHSDDSVLFVQDNTPYFIRRSKGYVPIPFFSSETRADILSVGSDLKNSFGIAKNNFIILSQFTGDLESPSTEDIFLKSLDNFKNLFDLNPRIIVSDRHPAYYSTRIAADYAKTGLEHIQVYHHHAHIASVLEENKLEEKVIGIVFDGTGFGTDGNIWGGEILIADKSEFRRAAHFSYFQLPGGDRAIKEVDRIGLSLLYNAFGREPDISNPSGKGKNILKIIEKNINSPLCCSVGRIFDGISSILDICNYSTTEAEAAIKLEECALNAQRDIPLKIDYSPHPLPESDFLIHTDSLVRKIKEMKISKVKVADISLAFHRAIIGVCVEISRELRLKYKIDKVALSGGVFQNRLLLSLLLKEMKAAGFKTFTPIELPFNDGCIAHGQIAVAKDILDQRHSPAG
jgi:hydrogenase maturation protein HypF